jgi:hypothetical protein
MYAIGPLAILYFLYETFKERGSITEETNRAAFIHPFFYRFLGILRTKWWFLALLQRQLA